MCQLTQPQLNASFGMSVVSRGASGQTETGRKCMVCCTYLPSSPNDPLRLTFILRLRPPVVSPCSPLGVSLGLAAAAGGISFLRILARGCPSKHLRQQFNDAFGLKHVTDADRWSCVQYSTRSLCSCYSQTSQTCSYYGNSQNFMSIASQSACLTWREWRTHATMNTAGDGQTYSISAC